MCGLDEKNIVSDGKHVIGGDHFSTYPFDRLKSPKGAADFGRIRAFRFYRTWCKEGMAPEEGGCSEPFFP